MHRTIERHDRITYAVPVCHKVRPMFFISLTSSLPIWSPNLCLQAMKEAPSAVDHRQTLTVGFYTLRLACQIVILHPLHAWLGLEVSLLITIMASYVLYSRKSKLLPQPGLIAVSQPTKLTLASCSSLQVTKLGSCSGVGIHRNLDRELARPRWVFSIN